MPRASPLIYDRGVTLPLNLARLIAAVAATWLLAYPLNRGNAAADSRLAAPVDLRIGGVSEPLAVTGAMPEFSWRVEAAAPALHGVGQSGFEIRVAASERDLAGGRGLLWDTGKIPSHATSAPGASYSGPALEPQQAYAWQVRAWDENDHPSDWSQPAHWTQAPEWRARWIAADSTDAAAGSKPMPLFRKQFGVRDEIKRALLNVSGLGQYEFHINGAKVGDSELTPGWSDYRKTVFYDTYDVTSMVHDGENALGIMLGNGMYRVLKTAGAVHEIHRHLWAAEVHCATAHRVP